MWRSPTILLLGLAFLLSASTVSAAQRTVLAEEFTGTWCYYCPGAQMGLEELEALTLDSVAVAAFHTGDAFSTAETEARNDFYGITGVPTVIFEGTDWEVGGYHSQSMYSYYRPHFDTWAATPTNVVMVLDGTYDPTARTGEVTVHIMNTGRSSVSGTLQFALTETHIPYAWQEQDSLFNVVRDMLPDAAGETVTIAGNSVLDKSRTFTVSSGWRDWNCQVVAYLQDPASREVYQAAKWSVRPPVSLTVTPDTTPVIIPPQGGDLGATIRLVNSTNTSQTFDFWAHALLPGGVAYPTYPRTTMVVPPGGSRSLHYVGPVPANAPPGNYTFVARVGTYPASTMDVGYFPGIKTKTVDDKDNRQVCPVR